MLRCDLSGMKVYVNNVKVDSNKIRRLILHAITVSKKKLTYGAIEDLVKTKLPVRRSDIRQAIKSLVSGGELSYSYIYGSSFLERSFNRPVRITKKVVLMPPGVSHPEKLDDIPIIIQPGFSFGAGDHPTTRLALSGLESAMMHRIASGKSIETALDIGTGTGVLALAAAKFGIETAIGIDTDQCARWEAKKNVRLNGLRDRVDITAQPVENMQRTFDLVLANLRIPTLKKLCRFMRNLTALSGSVVISGIKAEETQSLVEQYLKEGFKMVWEKEEKGWVGLVLAG